jgi:hypothetical protein
VTNIRGNVHISSQISQDPETAEARLKRVLQAAFIFSTQFYLAIQAASFITIICNKSAIVFV